MGVIEVVEECVTAARQEYAEAHPEAPLRIVMSEPETVWHKLDHLPACACTHADRLYLPVLHLTRPSELYYYQGAGLQVLYGFTYKYLTVEHFLGEAARLRIGYSLAAALARSACACTHADRCYSQAWYPGNEPLFIFTDWHTKAHWTKHRTHSGHIAMLERVMPGTKQLIVNGPDGHLLGGWNYAVDTHLSGVLVDLEAELATCLGRPIAYNVFDSEGSGLPLAERYAKAGRYYVTVLPRQGDQSLAAFEVLGEWEAVAGDPDHEAVYACWKEPQKAQADPRRLVLMRRPGDANPTRVYSLPAATYSAQAGGCIPEHLTAGVVPACFRQRWPYQERVIRQMVNGTNLNANYGYTYREVPNRTAQRQWEEAQGKVEVAERRLAQEEEALLNLRRKLDALRHAYCREREVLEKAIEHKRAEIAQRQQAGQPTQLHQKGLHSRQQRLADLTARFHRRHRQLLKRFARHRARQCQLNLELAERRAARDAIDTATLCRERDLEKDQSMLNLQVLLTSLHDWARSRYFAPVWRNLELNTAMEMVYRKPGRVKWGREVIEVMLDPYRYADQQQAMEETCRRFNEVQARWRDGRLLHIRVARETRFHLCDC